MRRWSAIARTAVGLALLGVVLLSLDVGEVAESLAATDVRLALVGILGLTAMHLVGGAAWRSIILALSGLRLPWRMVLPAYYASQAIGGATPANVGGDLQRAIAMRSAGHGWWAAGAPIVVQRASSYVALTALSLIGLGLLATSTQLAMAIMLPALTVSITVALVAWLLLAPPAGLRGPSRWLMRVFAGRAQMEREAATAPADGASRAGLLGFGYGIAFHAGSIGLTGLLVAAVAGTAPSLPMLGALALARLSLALPISPSGLGVQEGAFVFLAGTVGLAPPVALAAMLLARVSLLLTTVIGVGLLVGGLSVPRLVPHEAPNARG